MKEFLKQLNEAQYKAATTINGRVLIYAGAGTGKTFTIVSRVANMIDKGIPAEEILLLTFTNKAAKEMRDRVKLLIGESANAVTACTFHSFCANFMRRYAPIIKLERNFNIIDTPDSSDAMSISRQEFIDDKKSEGIKYNLKDFPSTKILLLLHETAINNCISIDEVIEEYFLSAYANEIKIILKKFMKYKRDRNILDYNDLLFFTKRILEEHEDIRHLMDNQFKYIQCDEYQDTNVIQNQILNLLSRDYQNLAVIGDDNQSIYGWRGANIENILSFNRVYPDCQTIILYENYRSSQEILNFANSVMSYATEGQEKKLHGQFHGENPKLVVVDNNYLENEYIINKIQEYYNSGISLKSMAVIARSARQTFGLELELNKIGMPFEKFGGIKFMEKAVIKDIMAFLRVCVNKKDELAWFRILQNYPGIGKTFARKISASICLNGIDILDTLYSKRKFAIYLAELKSTITKIDILELNDQLKYIIETYYPDIITRKIDSMDISDIGKMDLKIELKESLEEAIALYDLSSDYKTASKFLSDIALDATSNINNGDVLNITTIHSAKGLEYDVVFLMDAIEGITPKCKEGDDMDPEELRVFYVAITRSKKYLHVIVPKYCYSPLAINGILSHFINKDDVIDKLDNIYNIDLKPLRNDFDYFDLY